MYLKKESKDKSKNLSENCSDDNNNKDIEAFEENQIFTISKGNKLKNK